MRNSPSSELPRLVQPHVDLGDLDRSRVVEELAVEVHFLQELLVCRVEIEWNVVAVFQDGSSTHVVMVSVRGQDREGPESVFLDQRSDGHGVIAGVDDHCGASSVTHDVAVLLPRSGDHHADLKPHQTPPL